MTDDKSILSVYNCRLLHVLGFAFLCNSCVFEKLPGPTFMWQMHLKTTVQAETAYARLRIFNLISLLPTPFVATRWKDR